MQTDPTHKQMLTCTMQVNPPRNRCQGRQFPLFTPATQPAPAPQLQQPLAQVPNARPQTAHDPPGMVKRTRHAAEHAGSQSPKVIITAQSVTSCMICGYCPTVHVWTLTANSSLLQKAIPLNRQASDHHLTLLTMQSIVGRSMDGNARDVIIQYAQTHRNHLHHLVLRRHSVLLDRAHAVGAPDPSRGRSPAEGGRAHRGSAPFARRRRPRAWCASSAVKSRRPEPALGAISRGVSLPDQIARRLPSTPIFSTTP